MRRVASAGTAPSRAATFGVSNVALMAAGVAAGLLVAAVLPWWRHADGGWSMSLAGGEVAAFVVLAGLVVGALAPLRAMSGRPWNWPALVVFAALAVALSFTTVTFFTTDVAWHH